MTEEVKSIDLKDTLEYFAALKVLATAANEIMADGKVDWNDVGSFVKLASEYKVFVAAIEDSGNVGKELKNLDEAEFLVLGKEVFQLISSTVDSLKKAKEIAKAPKAKAAPKAAVKK